MSTPTYVPVVKEQKKDEPPAYGLWVGAAVALVALAVLVYYLATPAPDGDDPAPPAAAAGGGVPAQLALYLSSAQFSDPPAMV